MFGVPDNEEYINNLKEKEKKERRRNKQDILYPLFKLVFFSCALFLLFTQVFAININTGTDMYPSIKDGDLLISYRLDPPMVEDIIVFDKNNTTYVGRVVAQAGDTVDLDGEGNLLINGNIQDENIFYSTLEMPQSDVKFPFVVDDENYFILSDLRTTGIDSRTFGSVHQKSITGTVISFLRIRGL